MKFKDADFCIKTRFLNAVLNRWESKYTQDDVSNYLSISKRTVVDLEKGKVNNIVTVLNYIHFFGVNNAKENKIKNNKKYYDRLYRRRKSK